VAGDCQAEPSLDLVCEMISTEPHFYFCESGGPPAGTCVEEGNGQYCCR
jgi:hypothetical protein